MSIVGKSWRELWRVLRGKISVERGSMKEVRRSLDKKTGWWECEMYGKS